ncbi:MAG: dockerin type I repeat-containing protein [Candidatus Falkowbacteria bacterium]
MHLRFKKIAVFLGIAFSIAGQPNMTQSAPNVSFQLMILSSTTPIVTTTTPTSTPSIPSIIPINYPAWPQVASIIFSGKGYPGGKVIILRDGQSVIESMVNNIGDFTGVLTNLAPGSYNFSVIGQDELGNRSSILPIIIVLNAGTTVYINKITLAPTISINQSSFTVKTPIIISGYGQSETRIALHSNLPNATNLFSTSDHSGYYKFSILNQTVPGNYRIITQQIINGQASEPSTPINISIFTKAITSPSKKCRTKGDLNNDCRVNLIDFSIAAYWYKRPLTKSIIILEKEKLNGDGKINLQDFSIMAYYWNG